MKKLFTILALLSASVMSWATDYCSETVSTNHESITVTVKKTGDLQTTFIFEHEKIANSTSWQGYNPINLGNGTLSGADLAASTAITYSTGKLTCVTTWSSYPTSNMDIFFSIYRDNTDLQGDIFTFTLTDINASKVCADAVADATPPTMTSASKESQTYNSVVINVEGTDNIGVTKYVVKNHSDNSSVGEYVPSSGTISVSGLTENTPYDWDIYAKDAAGNISANSINVSFSTDARPSECSGDLGHFGTWSTKRVHYTIEYLPISNKIKYTVNGINGNTLTYLNIRTTAGNSGNLGIAEGVATWLQTPPAAGTEMGINFEYGTDQIPGHEMNSESLSMTFTGNNAHLVYYKSQDCEVVEMAEPTPTTVLANDESRELCQVQGVFGVTKYPAPGFTRYEPTWGGSSYETTSIDGKNVAHVTSGAGFAVGIGDKDVRSYTNIRFDVWCATAETFGFQLVCYNYGWQNGTKKTFNTAAESWTTIDIPLSEFEQSDANLKTSVLLYFQDLANKQIYITNIYYYTDSDVCASEPTDAPAAPLQKDCQVYSLFSDYNYTDQVAKLNHSTWCGGTIEEITIDGQKIKKLSGSTGCYGFEKQNWNTTGVIDVHDYDYLHVDVWVPQITTLDIRPINRNSTDNGNEEQPLYREITTVGSWQSLDIPVSEFIDKGVSMERLYQFKFDGLSGKKMWFTNLYFYKTADCTPEWSTWNLARNKPSVAGYEWTNQDEKKEKANDGLESSSWVTYNVSSSDDEWWYVDLQHNYNINKIEVVWGDLYSTSYKLQTRVDAPSNTDQSDDSKWVDVTAEPVANAAEGTVTTDGLTATGRYVRIHSLTKSGGFFRMKEFRVFGTGYAVTDVNDPEITTAEVADDSENITSVKLHLVATDVEDGSVKTFMLNKGDDVWTQITTDASDFYTVTELPRGHYSYQVKARDIAGNVSEARTINFDIFNPADNLAYKKDVVAGYIPGNADEVPSKVNDGSLTSAWTTWNDQPMDKQWWSVDLGDVYQLSSIDLFWGDRSDNYLIQVAHSEPTDRSDDTQWFTILEVDETQTTGNAEANKNTYALNASARYVRFKAVTKAGSFLKLWELRLFGSAFAEADANAPEITNASVTYNDGKAYLTLVANDTEEGAIKLFRVVNTTNGTKQLLTTNADNQIIIEDLEPNTIYAFEIQAMDKAANLSAVTAININVPLSGDENIAKNKPSYAGYGLNNTNEKIENGNDGVSSTYWCTWSIPSLDDAWWYVDLQKVYSLSRIDILWNDPDLNSTEYILQGRLEAPTDAQAADDNEWITLTSSATVAHDRYTTLQQTDVDGTIPVRYVRFRSIHQIGAYIKMNDFRVYANSEVLTLSETSNADILSANNGSLVSAVIPRTFPETDEWYTLCLPFNMSAAQMETSFGAGYKLAELKSSEDRGSLIHLNFDYVQTLEAGKPYMLKPGTAVTSNPIVEGVTIQNITPAPVNTTYMNFVGLFEATTLDQDNQRFVGADNYVYSPREGGTPIKAFRCYFTIPTSSPAPAKRAKLVFAGEQTATDLENVERTDAPSIKVMENGILYIIRDGRMYNAQGMLVK